MVPRGGRHEEGEEEEAFRADSDLSPKHSQRRTQLNSGSTDRQLMGRKWTVGHLLRATAVEYVGFFTVYSLLTGEKVVHRDWWHLKTRFPPSSYCKCGTTCADLSEFIYFVCCPSAPSSSCQTELALAVSEEYRYRWPLCKVALFCPRLVMAQG